MCEFSLQSFVLDAVAAHKTHKENRLHLRLRKRQEQPQGHKMEEMLAEDGEEMRVKMVAGGAHTKADLIAAMVEAEMVFGILLAKVNPGE